MKLTSEQHRMIRAASEGHTLMTAPGSPNDVLWGEMAERGVMEPADLPGNLARFGASLHAWKMTDGGKKRFRELVERFA